MRILGFGAVLLISLVGTAFAQTVTFTNVNVVPMDSPGVLPDHVVVVEGGTIAAMAPMGSIEPPEGSAIIDGQSGYLMPGLADMHMHLVGDFNYRDPEQLLFFLAQGTTTVRVLGAPPLALSWREQVLSGDLIGPRIYAMGPTLVGNYGDEMGVRAVILSMDAARFSVPVLLAMFVVLAFRRFRSRRSLALAGIAGFAVGGALFLSEQPPLNMLNPIFDVPQAHVFEDRASPVQAVVSRFQSKGYDGIKVYDGLTERQFLTAVTAAGQEGFYSVGHLLNQVPLDVQLSSGLQGVAHVDEFLSHHWVGYNMGKDPDPQYDKLRNYPVDSSTIHQTVQLVGDNGVSVVSNLSTDEALYRLLLDPEGTLAEPRFKEFRPDYVEGWKTRGRHFGPFAGQGEYRRDEIQPFLSALVKSLHDAGVPITIGTDAGGSAPEGSIPSDIHREIELLVDAGLTNYEALAAGTTMAGQVINEMTGDVQGKVTVGSAADLILLSGNPINNVSATRDRVGVMANGIWYPQKDLDELVTDYLASREW